MSLARRLQKIKKRLFKSKKTDSGSRPEDKILSEHTPFFAKEAYKALRTNLIFSLPDAGSKVILITSSCASEGKSTSCLNTAITFAETGARVCLVDCDLRKPNIAKLMMQKGSPGLSNVLVHLNQLDEVIRHSKYQNLDCIYSGDIPPNPAELLVSSKMEEVLEALCQQYDYIFIDTPPVNVVTDVSLLAGRANGVLLVVKQGETTKEDLEEAVQQLEFVKARILGVLLNGVKASGRKGAKYGKKGYYKNRYYQEDAESVRVSDG